MSKKRIIPLAAIAAGMLALTACAPSSGESGVTTITMFFVGEATELQIKQDLIAKFEKEHPDIKVDETYVTGTQANEKLETYFSSHTVPDVIYSATPSLDAYGSSGAYEDLAPYVERDGLEDLWPADLYSALNKNDVQVLVPWGWKSMSLAYNKDLFDEAGVEYPTSSWTEDDFLDAAKKITGVDGKDVWGFNPSFYLDWGQLNMYGDPNYDVATGEMTAAGNKSYIHGLDLMNTLIQNGEAIVPSSGAAADAGFVGGQIGMQIVGSWDPDVFVGSIGDTFSWDLINLPSDSDFGAWTAPLLLDGLGISSESSHKDAAWELVRYLTTDEAAQEAIGAFSAPALTTASEKWVTDFPEGVKPYNRSAFIDTKKVPWAFSGIWAEVNTQERALIDEMFAGKLTPTELADQLQEFGTPVLAGTGTGN